MERYTSCIVCGNRRCKRLISGRVSNIVCCTNCGLAKTENFNAPDYTNYHRDEDYQKDEWLFKNFFLKRLRIIEKYYSRTGKVLEIGCSTGIFLKLFSDKGWEVWGIEPSKSGKIAQSKGIRITKAYFENAILPKGFFDVIIFNHTLEHLRNPVETLLKARALLNKGGIVFVDVPNLGSLSFRLLGNYWGYLAPTEHLWHFTYMTLKRVFEKAGLKLIYYETASGVFDWGSPVKGLIDKLVYARKSFIWDLVSIPLAYINSKIGMGTNLTMIGKK